MKWIIRIVIVLLCAPVVPLNAQWYRGSLHVHTINSDGDSSPDAVVRWYREHGYNFVVLTDHNFVTDVRGINALLAAAGQFLVLPGIEVTDRFITPGGKSLPVHVNAILPRRNLPPTGGTSVADVLRRNVDMVTAEAGACVVNHPNYIWAIDYGQMLEVENIRLFELASQDPEVCNHGGGGHLSTEALWDSLLSNGRRVYGVAGDDAHHFKNWGPDFINPGRGWVTVRCDSLEAQALVDALNRGDFYSSTGVELTDVRSDGRSLTVEIEGAGRGNTEYTVTFIGNGGRTLATELKSPAVYKFRGGEGYVRAKVVDSNGRIAWTQPVFP